MKKNIKKSKKPTDLLLRTLINGLSTVLIAIFIFLGASPPLRWVFTAFVALVTAVALWEYYQLVKKKTLNPAVWLGLIAGVLYVFAVFFKTQGPHLIWEPVWYNAPVIILALTFFACFLFYAWLGKAPIENIATTFLGIVYIAIPLGLFVRIMYFFTFEGASDPLYRGSYWIIYLLVVTKSADMGGYFFGHFFGKRKLAFKLSPNKTFEGALGGLIVAVLLSLLLCFLGKKIGDVFQEFSYLESIWLGAIIGILGQIGDLAESLLKRDANVKDSNSIPGVGGILDMTDSLLFTSPVVYIFLRIGS